MYRHSSKQGSSKTVFNLKWWISDSKAISTISILISDGNAKWNTGFQTAECVLRKY